MRRASVSIIGLAAAFALAVPGASYGESANCCIDGTWQGTISQTLSKSCPEPAVTEAFTFVIVQGGRCGQNVTGTVTTHPEGHIMKFKGTAKPSTKKCCTLEGTVTSTSDPTDVSTISVEICSQKTFGPASSTALEGTGTAHSVSGTAPNQRACEGTLHMTRP
jgi:hypothetical protein